MNLKGRKKGLYILKSKMPKDVEATNYDLPTEMLPVIEWGKCNIIRFNSNKPKRFLQSYAEGLQMVSVVIKSSEA